MAEAFDNAPMPRIHEQLSYAVVGACMRVHARLGPGLLERVYARCVGLELGARGLRFEEQRPLTVVYRGRTIRNAYRLDFVVEDALVLELKSVANLVPVHLAQLRTYLRLSEMQVGLLVNFNVDNLLHGIERLQLPSAHPPNRSKSPQNPSPPPEVQAPRRPPSRNR